MTRLSAGCRSMAIILAVGCMEASPTLSRGSGEGARELFLWGQVSGDSPVGRLPQYGDDPGCRLYGGQSGGHGLPQRWVQGGRELRRAEGLPVTQAVPHGGGAAVHCPASIAVSGGEQRALKTSIGLQGF